VSAVSFNVFVTSCAFKAFETYGSNPPAALALNSRDQRLSNAGEYAYVQRTTLNGLIDNGPVLLMHKRNVILIQFGCKTRPRSMWRVQRFPIRNNMTVWTRDGPPAFHLQNSGRWSVRSPFSRFSFGTSVPSEPWHHRELVFIKHI
jgi:hypothetical protein